MSKSKSPEPWGGYGLFSAQSKARAVLKILADLIWPPVSPVSGQPVSSSGELDAADWASLTFIEAPYCAQCGVPFEYPVGAGFVCGACAARAPAYRLARSVLVYNENSRALPLALKHAGRTDALAAYGRWMARAGAEALTGADALIPIPLHPRRLRQRRFNQSLLLARSIARASPIAVDPHCLARTRATPIQGGLSAKGRVRNVAGAFQVRAEAEPRVRGGRFVLIDDVHTTGATLEAAARTLTRAGAEDVTAITLARVVKPVHLIK